MSNDNTTISWSADFAIGVPWPEARERIAAQLGCDQEAAETVLCAIFTGRTAETVA